MLSALELDFLVDGDVIIVGLGLTVNGSNSNRANSLGLVKNLDTESSSGLGDRVVKAGESELLVLLVLLK